MHFVSQIKIEYYFVYINSCVYYRLYYYYN